MIGLPYGQKNMIPELTNGQTELLYQYRASVCRRDKNHQADSEIRYGTLTTGHSDISNLNLAKYNWSGTLLGFAILFDHTGIHLY